MHLIQILLIFSFLEVKLVSVGRSRHWLIWSSELKGRTPSFCPWAVTQMTIWGSQGICERNVTFWLELRVVFLCSSCYFESLCQINSARACVCEDLLALCCFSVSSSISIHKLVLPDCAQPRRYVGLRWNISSNNMFSQFFGFFKEDELVRPRICPIWYYPSFL